MNPKSSAANSASAHDARIDAALRLYGGAVPAPGLESRVATRISGMPATAFRSATSLRLLVFRRLSVGALAAAAACAIVAGTVQQSHRTGLPPLARVPQSGGAGNSGAIHVPTRAVPEAAKIDPKTLHTAPHRRATVAPNPERRSGEPSAAQR